MNRYLLSFVCLIIFPFSASPQALKVANLRCEYKKDPLGINTVHPHLKWELESVKRNVVQTAYRVIVSRSPGALEKNQGLLWDSKKVASDASLQITYQGDSLTAAETCYWKVMVWDNRGDSAWSDVASWQTGLLSRADWEGASWIAYRKLPDSARILPGDPHEKKGRRNDILPLFRKEFPIKKTIKKATAFVCGLGQFELYLNGEKVGDHFLDPSWTQYEKEASYVAFDITGQLRNGTNALGVMLGNGFYYIPQAGKRYHKLIVAYGHPAMICMVRIQYSDGTSENIISDRSWKTAAGPIIFSSVYGGEDYNANLEQPGWNKPGFNDKAWKTPVVVRGPADLTGRIEDPIKIFDHFKPKKVYQPGPGVWVYDLGQNASGIPRISVKGSRGDTVRITPAEVVDQNGMISQRGSGGPSYFTYILNGKGNETWQPRFSYYGFRYVEIRGAVPEGKPNPGGLPVIGAVQGLHIRNAAPVTGTFSCSNELFNRIFKLIDWSIQSNMVSLFTDCPHREKLGWLEEAHLMGGSVHYNYDISNLCRRTILNMEAAQTPEGLVPEIAPEYVQFTKPFRDSPEWGSSSVIVPWYVYLWYGDTRVLEQSYPMMKRYVDYLGTQAVGHLLSYGLSDWFDLGPGHLGVAQLTPMGVTGTAIYYYDLSIMDQIAVLLHKTEDARQFRALAVQVKKAFNDKFFHPETKEYATGSQTSNAMALFMGLVKPEDRSAVADNLVADIKSHNNSLTSGDIGYRYLLKALDAAGKSDVIYKMNNRSDVPGYGYQLAKGATALTESWQAYPSVSNDHFMLGHLMEWLYEGLAGISQTDSSVAYHQLEIAPEPVGDITSCRASFESPYGKISSRWERKNGTFALTVEIPANTTAIIKIPAANRNVTEGGHPLTGQDGITQLGYRDGKVILSAGSGIYRFSAE